MDVTPGDPGTPEDEADVGISLRLSDVRNASDLTDYTGEVDARANVRITDKLNGVPVTDAATVSDFELAFPATCAASDCSVSTTTDALVPGMAPEGARSIWELDAITVDDGGVDGLASTPDNEPFAVQGVFVP
jgi:hypothetical protein